MANSQPELLSLLQMMCTCFYHRGIDVCVRAEIGWWRREPPETSLQSQPYLSPPSLPLLLSLSVTQDGRQEESL
jgi:hypothetical protein